jgi:hypothetical protein
MSQAVIEQSDSEILRLEVEEYNQSAVLMKTLILRAADKLAKSGKYNEDYSVISSRLCKVFPNWSPGSIRNTLPKEYKREKELDTPQVVDEIDEIMQRLSDSMIDLGMWVKEMQRKMRKDNEYKNIVLNQFGGADEFIGFMKSWIEVEAEISLLKSVSDDRERIDITVKILTKIHLRTINLRKVAEMAGVTHKWLKSKNYNKDNIINRSIDRIEELCQEFFGPDFRLNTWLREQEARYKKSLSVPTFPELRDGVKQRIITESNK